MNGTRENEAIRNDGLLIVECTPEAFEGKQNEGNFLRELATVLRPTINVKVESVNSDRKFLEILGESTESVVHISAHGRDYLSKHNFLGVKGTIIRFSEGFVTSQQISKKLLEKKKKERPKLIVMSACQSGSNEMVRAIKEAGCRYFIAPMENTYWFDAAVFIALFYRLLFIEGSTPWVSFRKTDNALKSLLRNYSGYWNFYDYGRNCFLSNGRKNSFLV